MDQYLNCQQVKFDAQPDGTLQGMRNTEQKCERITVDFISGLPLTLGKFDFVSVIVDILTKLAHLIPVKVTYNIEKLVKIDIGEIVRFHDVSISIVSYRGTLFTLIFGVPVRVIWVLCFI